MKKILLLLIILFSQDIYAQSILRLQHINVEDGLSQSSVNNIFQDSHGFMWFATGDGLNRYDGKEFIAYKSRFNDTSSAQLKDRTINSQIFEDKENKLWMTSDAGIYFMDYRHRKTGVVTDNKGEKVYGYPLAMDNDSLWVVQPQVGICAINIDNLHYKIYPLTDKWQTDPDKVYTIRNGALQGGKLWIADAAGFLLFDKCRYNDKRLIINDNIRSATPLQNGRLLLTAYNGIYFYDTGKNTSEFVPLIFESGKPLQWERAVEDIKTHTVYVCALNSNIICKMSIDTRKYEFINFQKNIINCLFIDYSQNLWIGTEGNGIYKLDIKPPKFFCFTSDMLGSGVANGLMVKSIYRHDSGKILLGTFNNGLLFYDPVTQTQRKITLPYPTDGQLISTILKDSSGNLIITLGDKVLWLDPITFKIHQKVILPDTRPISSQRIIIYCFTEWKKDHYLAGTNVGLYVINNENGKASATQPFPDNNFVKQWTYSFYKEKSGVIYVGKRSGFAKIRMLRDSVLQLLDEGFEQVPIRHFYKSSNSPILWIAAEKGLVAYNEATKQYKGFDETSGLANSFVYAILAENDSSLWISTNQGISNVKVHYDTAVEARFVNYTSKDGLQSNEFNTGAYYQCKDGTLFFGGIAGINWFQPNDIKPNPGKASPAIANIFVDDKLFAADTATYIRTITLPFDRNTVSMSLRSLEYTNTAQNQFAYKLEGLDKDWVYTTSDKVRYSNLPPGTYTFLLKVSNNDQVWNDQPLKIRIVVQPPFWETWWFRTMIILLSIIICYVAVRVYVKQKVKAKTRELEKQKALYLERMRISKDVHDDLGSGLSKISLMAEIAQKRSSGDAAIGNDIRHISVVSKELVENMRDLIWVLNPENTTLDQLVARLREYCADYLESLPVTVELDFPNRVDPLPISREVQRNVFLTVKEAINNCIKHAKARSLEVVLKLDAGKMDISVHDDGNGFDMAHLKGSGNGLRNMRQRIEWIGGSFHIASSAGTTISISIPFSSLLVDNNTLV